MNISGFKIRRFAQDIYTKEQTPQLHELNSESVLIHGPNQSGKSLTFNALLYGVLGLDESLGIRPGGGNKMSVTFTDGSRITRAEPKRKYEWNGEVYTKDTAEEKLRGRVGETQILRHHFLHSHLDQLPLTTLSRKQRLDLILSVTNRSSKRRVEELESLIEEKNTRLVEKSDKQSRLENRHNRLTVTISKLERQQDEWQELIEIAESGRLDEIRDTLARDQSLKQEVDRLYKKRKGLNRKISEKEEEIDELQRFETEIEDIIVEAMKEFVCPVCEGRVNSETAKDRIHSDDTCPFCNQENSIQGLKENLRSEKLEAEGRPEKLTEEIDEHENELEEVNTEIREIEERQPELSNLNSKAVDRLEQGMTTSEILEEARTNLSQVETELNDSQARLSEIEDDLSKTEEQRELIDSDIDDFKRELNEIRADSYTRALNDFEKTWTEHFNMLSGELGRGVEINPDNGAIGLPGEDERRIYNRRGELSDSEIQLLNISFALALNSHADATDIIDWSVIVMDEPFSHLDEDIKFQALEHLKSVDQQIVITSSDQAMIEEFPSERILKLKRATIDQTSLEEWGA
ncbi:hypothetical protein [Haloarcula salinisoli]|uniref:AAA+ ATPase domain-containing protein n=1 Tax=Haloarcula salinisoli TaxID=2487746 RepID=A0A8J7YQ92_9EURY|nr:hypothetical protein [Halomicroarcula salinisoli]MBX0305363.1 hypothetical protein [Halomicroarcula salinisoli]